MEDIRNFFKNKKILITGHTGFKGGWLAKILLNWGADLAGIALKPSTNPNFFEALDIEKNVRNYRHDYSTFIYRIKWMHIAYFKNHW